MTTRVLLPAGLALLAGPALAQAGPGKLGSLLAGLSHPLEGSDRILAMVAVGLWGAVLGRRARWALPTAFVAAMVAGFGLALAGVGLPRCGGPLMGWCISMIL